MGVPKFYRWISERYPKINQRYGCRPSDKLCLEHFDKPVPDIVGLARPDPLAECGLSPPIEIDRLYIDMNGIIHGCSHNNVSDEEESNQITEDEIFQNVAYYLDRIVSEVAQPQQLLYLAIDGVAPRAKLNQQRARRYRSGKGGEIEQTIYDAHVIRRKQQQEQEQAAAMQQENNKSDDATTDNNNIDIDDHHHHHHHHRLKEVEPGRFAGKLEMQEGQDIEQIEPRTVMATTTPTDDTTTTTTIDATTVTTATNIFHSNSITPGTTFFQRCTAYLQDFIQRKLASDTDPAWQHLEVVIFSGPNVPGEGEHKIMQFMREQKTQQQNDNNNYNPNLRHCIMGQDGDLIMLGLVTHEPNLVLLREQVLFDKKQRRQDDLISKHGLDVYLYNANFELLHMNVLRDYLAFEFETSNVMMVPNNNNNDNNNNNNNDNSSPSSSSSSPFDFDIDDLEHVIDDFVFLTFLVGNDFLPHMPALDIADEAFDLLFYTYRSHRRKWVKEYMKQQQQQQQRNSNSNSDSSEQQLLPPYLTDSGTIVSGQRLEHFLSAVGAHELAYYDYKKSTQDVEQSRKLEARYGLKHTPSDAVLESKEELDRSRYRRMLLECSSVDGEIDDDEDNDFEKYPSEFTPVMSSSSSASSVLEQRHSSDSMVRQQRGDGEEDDDGDDDDEEERDDNGLFLRMENLLEFTVADADVIENEAKKSGVIIDDQDVKGRYYFDKFGFTPFDAEKHVALRKAYIEGLVWNLKYYYEGCVSWEWFYPYHYGPMMSDLVGLDDLLENTSFEDKLGEPLKPFQQLLACMPPSHSKLLPEPYRGLMTDEESPIVDFYPRTFTIDMNGKRWPWEAVVLLPFIDSERLVEASNSVDESLLTDEDLQRNQFGDPIVMSRDSLPEESDPIDLSTVKAVPFDSSPWYVNESKETPLFRPRLEEGVQAPLAGFPTLRDGSITGMWRKRLRVNVHGSTSRYKTACLEFQNTIPEIIPIETLAPQLIGTIVYINYPHFIEAFVTAVSDSASVIRGNSRPRPWNAQEYAARRGRLARVIDEYVKGERLVGTGGLSLAAGKDAMEELDVLLYVRPLIGLRTGPDGTVGKVFAKFEVEVPLFVTSWAPFRDDSRLADLPVLLEKDPYNAAKRVLTELPVRRSLNGKRSARGKQPETPIRYSPRGSKRVSRTQSVAKASRGFHSVAERSFSTPVDVSNGMPSLMRATAKPLRGKTNPRTASIASAAAFSNNFMSRRQRIPTGASRTLLTSRSGRLVTLGIVAAASFFSSVGATNNVDFGLTRQSLTPPNAVKESAMDLDPTTVNPYSERRVVPPLEFAHGTTTLSFTFRDGIVAAVDSRASLGSFVGSKTTRKVLPINSHMLGTMAGGAADCSFWIRKLRAEAALHEMTEGYRMSVARASRCLSNALYENRALRLSVGTMIMGFDDDEGAPPKIFYVDNSGMRIEGDLFAVGSGSTFALGILDTERRLDMSAEEAVALGIKAIRHATFRDAYSGGFINVYLITRDGWKHVFAEDLARLTDEAHSKDDATR